MPRPRPVVETWISGHAGLARIDGDLALVPDWIVRAAYRNALAVKDEDLKKGRAKIDQWDWDLYDRGLGNLIREMMTPRPAYLFRPGEPCPCDGCAGLMELERHVDGCACVPWGNPCSVCLHEVFGEGGDARPWIVCDTCDWMESDGGLSAHQMLEAMRRARVRDAD